MVADMVPVKVAYERAGYKGNDTTRSQLRNAPDVDARVKWLLMNRVDADTKARHRAEKKTLALKDRVLQELERVAFGDARDLVQWDRVPVLDESGNVVGFKDEMIATPSRRLSPAQAASVKSVTTKSGSLKIDVHDKLNALEKLGKALGLFNDLTPPPAPNVTVTQVNIGEVAAVEAARRVAFLLANLPGQEQVKTIDHEPPPHPGKPER